MFTEWVYIAFTLSGLGSISTKVRWFYFSIILQCYVLLLPDNFSSLVFQHSYDGNYKSPGAYESFRRNQQAPSRLRRHNSNSSSYSIRRHSSMSSMGEARGPPIEVHSSGANAKQPAAQSLIFNISGKVLMIQRDKAQHIDTPHRGDGEEVEEYEENGKLVSFLLFNFLWIT